MALLTNFVLPVVAALLFLASLVFIMQAIIARSGRNRAAYGYGQQAARTNAQITFWKAAGMLLLALLVLGIWSILDAIEANRPEVEVQSPVTIELVAPTMIATATETAASTVASVPTTIPETPTSPLPTATATETATPSATPSLTPEPSAVVNSPNGLYLRNAPGGSTILELISDGTTLILLGEQQTSNDLDWVRVTTPAGNTGWVALDFIIVNQ